MDNIKLHGRLSLSAYFKGEKIWENEGENLIVSSGYDSILLALKGTENKNISKVQIGTSNTQTASTDTLITNPVDLSIASATVENSKLTISFSIDANTGNNTTFSEFGLVCADGTLFSRRVWPSFLKIQDLTIEGTWVISI